MQLDIPAAYRQVAPLLLRHLRVNWPVGIGLLQINSAGDNVWNCPCLGVWRPVAPAFGVPAACACSDLQLLQRPTVHAVNSQPDGPQQGHREAAATSPTPDQDSVKLLPVLQ